MPMRCWRAALGLDLIAHQPHTPGSSNLTLSKSFWTGLLLNSEYGHRLGHDAT